ncbi:MAG: 50S ribosomal protein L25 [Bryobacteraceae bacterium]
MKKDITISAEARETRGKNEARRLRVRGLAPAVLYGAGKDPVALSVSPKEVGRILNSNTGHNTIFNIDVAGRENTPVMIVDWQNDPIKSNLLHVDLKRIDLAARLTVKVPVQVTGEPKGVKQQGGLLELITREIEIECLPQDIPEHFTVDVTELMLGQSVRVGEIPMAASAKLTGSPDHVIAHVVAIKAEAEPVAEVVAEGVPAAAEPEIIKKGKKDEEVAAEPEAKGKKK